MLDLREYPMPFFSEAVTPSAKKEPYKEPAVAAWTAKIAEGDAFVMIAPEYNHGYSAVLKNAIDVASRPPGKSSFNGRPIGIIGTSPGAHGGVSAVKHLQQILPGISGPIMQQPETYLGGLGDAFDDKGELIKEPLRDFLNKYLTAFEAWVAHNAK